MTWDFGKTIQMLSIVVDYVQNTQEDKNAISSQEKIEIPEDLKKIEILENLKKKETKEEKLEGKTIENKGEKRASLVVSPSSLTLNWQNEAKKFAQELKTLVIRGTLAERKKQIEEIDQYDLVITSYDLLKRDIEWYLKKRLFIPIYHSRRSTISKK